MASLWKEMRDKGPIVIQRCVKVFLYVLQMCSSVLQNVHSGNSVLRVAKYQNSIFAY